MSFEMLEIHLNINNIDNFNPEKADIFSLGLSFVRLFYNKNIKLMY